MPASIADLSLPSKDELLLLERKLLDLAFGKVKFSVISALLLASLIVIALWSIIEHQRLLAWLAGIAGVKALHVLYLRRYKRHGHRADVHPGKWKMGLVAGAAATGLGWGCAVFCFPSSPFNPMTLFGVFVLPSTPFDPVTVLLIFILAGITAYASLALAFVPLAAFAFFACAWLPLAIWLFSFGEQMYVVMGLIALSYLGVMVMLSRRMYATVCSLISVSEENRGLRTAQQENDWRMQRFFESAPGFFYTACMTPDGKSSMPFASAGIHELFDLAPGEVMDSMSSLFALVRAEDIELVIKAREASRRNLSPFRIEFRINHRIKGERWIELNSMPQREPDGSTNWHGFMQDITERRRLEESLAASEREFRTLAENFPDVVIRYDLDGRRTYVNRALAELAGIEPDEMLGKFLEDTPLLDPEAYTAELNRVIATRDAALLEVAARETNGDVSWYQARFVPEFDAGNNVSGVLMVAGDITERRRMEQALQRREAEFRTLAENLPVAVIRYDAEQRRRYLNPAAERMLHGNMTELLGKVPGDGGVPATPAMIEHYRGKMKEVLATGEAHELDFALDELPADRQEYFEVRFVPERDADGQAAGVLAIWFDITGRKRMENEMRQQANFRQALLDAINEVGLQLMVIEDGRINYASNLKLAREFGYSDEEIAAGVPLMDIVHPDDRERVMDYHLRRAAGEAAPNSYELGLVTKRGERREYEASVAVLPGTSPLRIVSVGKDITERKRMEDELRLKESVLDQAHDGVYLIDENARFVYVNDQACRALGYSRDELLGMGVGDIDYAMSNESSLDVREKTLEQGGYSFVTQHRRRDGSLLPVEIQASTLTYQGKHLGLALARDITERKAIEKSLQDSERMLQEAQRIAHVGSWDVDMVNDKLVWSDEIFRIWEIDKTKFRADFAAFLETVHPEDRERVSQAYNEAVINHTLYEVEHRLLFPDGRVKHILERGEPQYDAQGKPVRFIGTSLDITERKRMEAELAERERDFRSLAENLPNNIARWDRQGRYVYINPGLDRLFGGTENVIGKTKSEAFPDGRFAEMEAIILSVVASGKKTTAPRQLVPDEHGEMRLHDITLVPEFDAAGKVVGVLGIGHDMTDIYRMQDELAVRERDFRSLAENLPDNIARWDVEGRYLYINPTHERTLGVAASEVIGKPIPDTHEHVKAAIAQVVASGRAVELVRQATLVNGELQVHEVTLVPEFDAAGHVVSVLGLGRNMTEFYRMQETIAAREQELRALAESSPGMMGAFHCRPDGSICMPYVSQKIEALFGLQPQDVLDDATPLLAMNHPDDAQRVAESIAESARNMTTWHEEYRVVHPVRGERWMESNTNPMPHPDGGVVWYGYIHDITERKLAEQALRVSEALAQSRHDLLQAIVESSPEIIVFALDTNYRYLSFNQKHKEVMRAIWGKEIAAGMNMLEVIGDHPDRKSAQGGMDRALAGESFVLEEAYGDELLSRQYWQNYWSPIRAETGEVVGLTCFVMNVSERRQAEEALRESGEKLRNLYEYSPVGIALTDMSGRYIEFNEAFRAICGYPHDELMALDYWTLTPREYEAQEKAQMESLEKTGRYGPYVKEYVRRDGSRVPIQLNGALIIGKDMKPYIWSIVEDITERKRTEALLKEKLERIVELNDYLEENSRMMEEHAVELEASQEQLKEALEFSNGVINAIPDILFEMDREGRYHGIWTQKPELLAAQKALLLNKTLHEVLPPEVADVALAAIREAEENGAAYGKVIAIPQPNGEVRWFEHSISRKQGSSPSDTRFIVLSRDVTERKQTEDILRFVAEGEWMRGGESFPDALVRYLGKSLGVDYVVIDKSADEPGYVETVARYVKGEIAPNVRYALQSTPCGEVMVGVHCCHGENIQVHFPESGLLKDMQVESYAGIPLRDSEGAVIGLIAVLDGKPLADMHFVKSILQMVAPSAAAELERSRMEQVLRENYDALNEAQRISHLGNWELDLASGALLWSDEIYRIFEIDPAQFDPSYDAFLDAIHPDDREAVSLAYETSLETRAPYEIEHRLLFADGRIKYVHERCETRYADDGKPLRSLGTVQDITARKQAEESLRESYERITELNRHLEKTAVHLEENARYLEEQTIELEASQEQIKQTEAWYRSILHSAPEGMLVVDDHGLIMQVNARLEAMFGYGSGELPGQPVEVLLPQVVREAHAGQRAGYFAGGAASRPAMVGKSLFGCRKDGSTFPVDVSLSRLPDLDGRRSAVCASVRDITERQAMEVARETALAEAQRLAQLRSAFMAQMSHELRTPLNGILGYTQNLLHGEPLGEKQVAGLNIIQHSGEHLLSLINGLLDHAAIEANKFELIEGDIELDSFLTAIIGIIRVRAEQKNLAFTCEAGSDLPAVVRGDAQRLRQVLINLLANAVKFTDNGEVILRVSFVAPSRIRFEVQDSGVGIAADQLENIFLPFEQTGEIQRRAGGSGLGLAISRTLVRLMGGDIRIESQPGAGSTFSFEIEIGVVQSGRAGLDAAALSERAETRAAQVTPMLPAPPREELDTLHALALRGSMRNVTRHADKLAEADARYRPFAAQLRRLAQSFQTKALVALIEQYRNREQEE